MGKWPNYPFSTVNSSVKHHGVYYCLAAQEDESLRKQHLRSTAWKLTIFWKGLVERCGFGPKFCSLQAHSTLWAVVCHPLPRRWLPFSAAVFWDVHTLLEPEFHSEQLKCNLLQRMPSWILPNSGKVIYWSRATVLPAMWTTSVCEYKFILLHSERVKVCCVGRCRTGAGCRDQVHLKGWSVHLLTYISESKPVPASWHLCCALIIYLFPSLGRRVMSMTRQRWETLEIPLGISSIPLLQLRCFFSPLTLAYLISVTRNSRINKSIAPALCSKSLFATSNQ